MWFLPLLGGNDSPDVRIDGDPAIITFVGGTATISQGGLTNVTINGDPAIITFVGGEATLTQGEPPASGGGVTVRPAVTVRPDVTVRPAVTVRPVG